MVDPEKAGGRSGNESDGSESSGIEAAIHPKVSSGIGTSFLSVSN